MHSDIAPDDQPSRRIGAVALIRNIAGDVLMVKPVYKAGWILPGGAAHQDESVADAVAREVLEELGLTLAFTHFLALDRTAVIAEENPVEGFNVVCDGGVLSDEDAAAVVVAPEALHEVERVKWVPVEELDDHALEYQSRRIRQALGAVNAGLRLPLLEVGRAD